MSRYQITRALMVALAAGLLTVGVAAAQGPIATLPGAAQIEWQSGVEGALALSVSGPEGFHLQQRFAPGDAAIFSVFDESGNLRPAGSYTFEVRVEPVLDAEARGELEAARAAGDGAVGALRKAGKIPAEGIVHSGYFAIESGTIVLDGEEEADAGQPAGGARLSAKDQLINDDLIVTGSLCVGFDCVNGESFGFDTIRLKENNLRIKFQDTSTAGSFPSNDWQLTANDSASGGANKFSIDDIDGGRTPFTIEASAPSHSLYVDDGGRVGFGTSTPVTELHVVDGDSPTLRLEQDGSSGFTPQTWDVAANETNFFVRDATNGSQLPLRIRPGADSNSIYVDTDNDVGIGTASPDASLDIERASDPTLRLTDTGGEAWDFRVTGGGNLTTASNTTTTNFILNNNGRVTINSDTAGEVTFDLANDGDLTITGDYFSATCTSPGNPCAPDYVFEPDYELMPLEELGKFVQTNKHLPNIPSADDLVTAGRLNMSQFQMQLLEKVEELTLYTLEQNDHIVSQQEHIASLREQKELLEERLERLEAAVSANQ